MTYKFYTTADGILDKHAKGLKDYELPDDLVNLLKTEDYGVYAHSDGELRVCFTGSNHTTGGNSGSPALNGKGHLVGLNFDRSWESTMSDIMFDPNQCRNIMVDVRYILWIVDKYAGASHLIDEMDLVKGGESKADSDVELDGYPMEDEELIGINFERGAYFKSCENNMNFSDESNCTNEKMMTFIHKK